jgi:hypothetical protein
MQNWIRDGERIKASYYGVPVSGIVESSRVKYGGQVQYTVILDTPIKLRWRTEDVSRVLIDCDDLYKDQG